MNLARGRLPAEFLLKGGDLSLDLRPSLRCPRTLFRGDADNLETLDGTAGVTRGLDLVAGGLHPAGELVLIDLPGITDRGEHLALGQSKPPVRLGIECGVRRDQMRVQLRVECPGGIVLEPGRAEVAGHQSLL